MCDENSGAFRDIERSWSKEYLHKDVRGKKLANLQYRSEKIHTEHDYSSKNTEEKNTNI